MQPTAVGRKRYLWRQQSLVHHCSKQLQYVKLSYQNIQSIYTDKKNKYSTEETLGKAEHESL